jgi:hypothetical protein
MAVRLYSEFKSDRGDQYKIEIHDTQWLAVATEFNVDSRGFELTYEGETDDIVSPIVSSRLTFGAYAANGTFETFIDTLKLFQENRFRVVVYRASASDVVEAFETRVEADGGTLESKSCLAADLSELGIETYELHWVGWVTQDLVQIEDSSRPYIFEITATDGLGRLANIDYDVLNDIDQGGLKLTRITQFAINALKLAGLYDLWDSNATFLETSADWWETSKHTYSTSTDPLYLTAVDTGLLQTYDDDNNLVYNNAFEALIQIATLFNARIYLSNGRWVLEQYGQRASASRYISRYKYDGTHINRTLINDDVVVDQTTFAARRSGNNFDFLPAMRKAQVNYIQKFLNPYGFFGGWRYTNATPTFTGGFMAGGPGIQLGIGTAAFNFSFKGASTQANLMPLLRATIALQDANGTTYYYGRSFNGTTATSMYTAEGWSVVPGFYYFDLKAISYIANQNATITEVVQIITQDLPTSGLISITIQLDSIRVMANNVPYNYTSVNVDAPMLFNIVNGGNQSNAGTIFSSVNNEVGIDSQLTLNLGDVFFAEGPPQTGHLAVFDGTSWVGSNLWRKGATGTGLRILKLLTSEALALHVRPIERYNGNIIGSFGFQSRLNFSSTSYLRTGGSFTANIEEWSGEMYAIQRIRTSISELEDVDVLERVPISGTATTSGTSPNDINSGRVAGMLIIPDERRLGPFEQTTTGAKINGTTNITGVATMERSTIIGLESFVDTFETRVTTDGGVVESKTCVSDAITALVGENMVSLIPTDISAPLTAAEPVVVKKTLDVDGATTMGSTLGVAGASTLATLSATATSVTTLSASSNASIGGTLGVTGTATMNSATINGAATLNSKTFVNGSWNSNIVDVTAEPSGVYKVGDNDYILFVTWSGGNGTFDIELPAVDASAGRMIRIKTDDTISNFKSLSIIPAEGDTGVLIDGEGSSSMTRSYDGATYLCHKGNWWVIQKKDKG